MYLNILDTLSIILKGYTEDTINNLTKRILDGFYLKFKTEFEEVYKLTPKRNRSYRDVFWNNYVEN